MAHMLKVTPAIIAKAWRDPAFMKLLLTDPVAALRAEGIPVPDGLKLTVHQNAPGRTHLVIPQHPQVSTLSEDDLVEIASRKLEAQLELTLSSTT